MTATVLCSTCYFIINSYQLIILVTTRDYDHLPGKIKQVHAHYFPSLTKHEFQKLHRFSLDCRLHHGDKIDSHIKTSKESVIILILSGNLLLIRDETVIAKLSPGDSMNLHSDNPYHLTLVADSNVRYLLWSDEMLSKLELNNSKLYNKFNHMIKLKLLKS